MLSCLYNKELSNETKKMMKKTTVWKWTELSTLRIVDLTTNLDIKWMDVKNTTKMV